LTRGADDRRDKLPYWRPFHKSHDSNPQFPFNQELPYQCFPILLSSRGGIKYLNDFSETAQISTQAPDSSNKRKKQERPRRKKRGQRKTISMNGWTTCFIGMRPRDPFLQQGKKKSLIPQKRTDALGKWSIRKRRKKPRSQKTRVKKGKKKKSAQEPKGLRVSYDEDRYFPVPPALHPPSQLSVSQSFMTIWI
jgi:hypothetical protein